MKKSLLAAIDWFWLSGGGSIAPAGSILEPDGINYLKEPNGDFVLEP